MAILLPDLELVPVRDEKGVWADPDLGAVHRRYLIDKAVERETGIDVSTLALHRDTENSALEAIDRGEKRKPRHVYPEGRILAFDAAIRQKEAPSGPGIFEGASLEALVSELQAENELLRAERSRWAEQRDAYEEAMGFLKEARKNDAQADAAIERARSGQ